MTHSAPLDDMPEALSELLDVSQPKDPLKHFRDRTIQSMARHIRKRLALGDPPDPLVRSAFHFYVYGSRMEPLCPPTEPLDDDLGWDVVDDSQEFPLGMGASL